MIDEPRHTHPDDNPTTARHPRDGVRDDFAGDGMTRNDVASDDMARSDTTRTDTTRTDARTDTGRTDTGRTDTGRTDTGRTDTGRTDTVTGERMPPDTAVRTDPATDDSRNGAPTAAADRATNGAGSLIPQQRAQEFDARWSAIKGEFVDEPRKAVTDADQLVGEFLDELQQSLNRRRQSIGESLAADSTSTESMRTALHDYRTMIDRLLATESR